MFAILVLKILNAFTRSADIVVGKLHNVRVTSISSGKI